MIRYNNDPPRPVDILNSLTQTQILEAKRTPYLFWQQYGFKVTVSNSAWQKIFSGRRRPMKKIRFGIVFMIKSKSRYYTAIPYQYVAWLVGNNGNLFIYHRGRQYEERAIHIRRPNRVARNEKI